MGPCSSPDTFQGNTGGTSWDLAATVQGAGLIIASILALSGAHLHFYARPTLIPPNDIRRALTIHLAAADLMWL